MNTNPAVEFKFRAHMEWPAIVRAAVRAAVHQRSTGFILVHAYGLTCGVNVYDSGEPVPLKPSIREFWARVQVSCALSTGAMTCPPSDCLATVQA